MIDQGPEKLLKIRFSKNGQILPEVDILSLREKFDEYPGTAANSNSGDKVSPDVLLFKTDDSNYLPSISLFEITSPSW